MVTLWLRNQLVGRRIHRETHRHLAALEQGPVFAAREETRRLLATLRSEAGPHVHLGETD